MRIAVTGARYVLGLILFVFGLNGFLGFLEQPPPPEAAGAFMGALVESGYVMTLVKAAEVVIGAMLLAGRWVPLALTALVPISVNIALYHVVLDLSMPGTAVAVSVFALNVFLMWAYRAYYEPLKTAKAVPAVGAASEPAAVVPSAA
ncbi:MAG: DoxX family protein [Bacteroidota bacterium]